MSKPQMIRGSQVWFNGKILPAESAKISLFTHTLHYGVGAFEGIRAYAQKTGGGAIFRLSEHNERLIESCKIAGFELPWTLEQLNQACVDICRANQFSECYLRPIAFIGDGPLGIYPGENPPIELAILAWVWPSYLSAQSVQAGARVRISSFIRPHVNSTMTKGKISGHYVNSVLAKKEAIQSGVDESLMVDTEGYLTEATGANLFMVKDGIVKTTPLNSILNGITRQTVMQLLRHQGLNVNEIRFTRDELWCADEVFLTGTAAEVTPIREIDGRIIGKGAHAGKVGPVAARLQKEFKGLTSGELKFEFSKNWLTVIA
jgi:branched-chain amino acid aminotransferase